MENAYNAVILIPQVVSNFLRPIPLPPLRQFQVGDKRWLVLCQSTYVIFNALPTKKKPEGTINNSPINQNVVRLSFLTWVITFSLLLYVRSIKTKLIFTFPSVPIWETLWYADMKYMSNGGLPLPL